MNEFPSFSEQAKNITELIADAIRDAVQNNTMFVTDEEKQSRYQMCEQCEYFESESKRCKQCGCFMEQKTGWAAAHCPVNKW